MPNKPIVNLEYISGRPQFAENRLLQNPDYLRGRIIDKEMGDRKVRDAAKQREYLAWLENDPQQLFNVKMNSLDQKQKDLFAPQYYDFYSQYRNASATPGEIGGKPTVSFKDWLDNMDWGKKYNDWFYAQPYINRGGYQARNLAPPARTLPY